MLFFFFFFQAEDGIRDLVRSRGLGDVYKRQVERCFAGTATRIEGIGMAEVGRETLMRHALAYPELSLIHI